MIKKKTIALGPVMIFPGTFSSFGDIQVSNGKFVNAIDKSKSACDIKTRYRRLDVDL